MDATIAEGTLLVLTRQLDEVLVDQLGGLNHEHVRRERAVGLGKEHKEATCRKRDENDHALSHILHFLLSFFNEHRQGSVVFADHLDLLPLSCFQESSRSVVDQAGAWRGGGIMNLAIVAPTAPISI